MDQQGLRKSVFAGKEGAWHEREGVALFAVEIGMEMVRLL